jgi:hypothetical protein
LQNFLVGPVQHCPELQEDVPQQSLVVAVQKELVPFGQHFWLEVQEVPPQQLAPVAEQNGLVPVAQQVWPEEHEVLPQQVLVLGTQKLFCVPTPGQHFWLLLHLGEHDALGAATA